MIGDIPSYANFRDPSVCLLTHSSDIQRRAVATVQSNPRWRSRQGIEQSVANAVSVGFIDTTKWLCVKSACPPIIDKKVVYLDWSHITATYSTFLSTVMGQALQGQY